MSSRTWRAVPLESDIKDFTDTATLSIPFATLYPRVLFIILTLSQWAATATAGVPKGGNFFYLEVARIQKEVPRSRRERIPSRTRRPVLSRLDRHHLSGFHSLSRVLYQ